MSRKRGMRPDRSFFIDSDVVTLSKRLLGCHLNTLVDGKITSGRIVETEAYRGRDDKACHAFNYKRTKRTETMFMEGGHTYVYLCYGIHNLFNIVVNVEGEPDAILIRALEPIEGVDEMLLRRKINKIKPQLTAGPGVLSKAMGIDKSMNNVDLTAIDSPVWIELKEPIEANNIISGPRIGINYAEECVEWPWRFCIKNNDYLSR